MRLMTVVLGTSLLAGPALAQTTYIVPPNPAAANRAGQVYRQGTAAARNDARDAQRNQAIANYDAATGNERGAAMAEQRAHQDSRDAHIDSRVAHQAARQAHEDSTWNVQ